MQKKMFLGADRLLFQRAEALRNNMTHAELLLWDYLKQKPLGLKFRRQHPLGIYIADFYCHSLKLVIEVDGNIHSDQEVAKRDHERMVNLQQDGISIIRFTNHEVEKQLEKVIAKIENYIKSTQTT